MIRVKAQRQSDLPPYYISTHYIDIYDFDNLTPKAAQQALAIAFAYRFLGEVWTLDNEYGYRVTLKSIRKIYPQY